jgi:hypothetical protein
MVVHTVGELRPSGYPGTGQIAQFNAVNAGAPRLESNTA